MASRTSIVPGLRAHLARLYPEHRIGAIEPLGPDTGATAGATSKAAGYGLPVRIVLEGPRDRVELVWRVAGSDEFGHDRRADRAANQLLAFDDFGHIPDHVRAIDVGAIREDGTLVSIGGGELYLITTYARGTMYAEDLRRIAQDGTASTADVERAAALARYLARLHVPMEGTQRYRRAIRDLVGHGEGVFGIVDGYPENVPGAPAELLRAIESSCVEWRWRLRAHEERLARIHGDFHPFNLVCEGDQFTALDASRGTCGEPADDVTALSINYVLFALDAPAAWPRGLGVLWRRFWAEYLRARPDAQLTAVSPPFFAWRALVVCNPRFYPRLGTRGREALLGLARRALDAGVLEPGAAEELFL
ncbi:MAG TPA: hypothetical protein VIV11_11220 [Kofleriaceae bacterium]